MGQKASNPKRAYVGDEISERYEAVANSPASIYIGGTRNGMSKNSSFYFRR
jgi:hypothetical protein